MGGGGFGGLGLPWSLKGAPKKKKKGRERREKRKKRERKGKGKLRKEEG